MNENDIVKYFTAEKNESLIFIAIGIIATVIAFYGYFFIKTEYFKGLFYPLLLVAAIQIFVGTTVYFRSPKDIERVTQQLKETPEKLKSEELPRMIVVNKNFVIYRYVEIALAILGILIMVFMGRVGFWGGVGAGLTVQALLMLSADYFAEQRALVYTDLLNKFIQTSLPS